MRLFVRSRTSPLVDRPARTPSPRALTPRLPAVVRSSGWPHARLPAGAEGAFLAARRRPAKLLDRAPFAYPRQQSCARATRALKHTRADRERRVAAGASPSSAFEPPPRVGRPTVGRFSARAASVLAPSGHRGDACARVVARRLAIAEPPASKRRVAPKSSLLCRPRVSALHRASQSDMPRRVRRSRRDRFPRGLSPATPRRERRTRRGISLWLAR